MPRLTRRVRRARERALHRRCSAVLFAWSVVAAPTLKVRADVPPTTAAKSAPGAEIFDPKKAPVIVLRIGVRRIALVPHSTGSGTTITTQAIENKANSSSLSSIITSSLAGAAAAPSGEIHIRGSHGQYSYFLDGAPLPANVSGSFTDLINPKDIETLHIYDGGFPLQYGGQLAAVFDVRAKAGQIGHTDGFLQQIAQSYATYETTAQYSAAQQDFAYFVSGIKSSSDFRLSPLTQTPYHDDGTETDGFGKFDYQSGPSDRITFDTGTSGAVIQVPNTYEQEQVGQNDIQRENGTFGNLIWRHLSGLNTLNVAVYSHSSQLRYDGDPTHDLLPAPGTTSTAGLTTTTQNQTAQYLGLRTDYTLAAGGAHNVGVGFDVNTVTGKQLFDSFGAPQPNAADDQPTLYENTRISGGDRSAYLQDNWTPGRFLFNYGARYDEHIADIETSQLSPRVNVTYTAGPQDKFHAYYDRLFQPIPVEDIIKIGPTSAFTSFQPERDNFYEGGWQHTIHATNLGLAAYYRTSKNAVDDQTYGDTQIDIPVNFAKGYTRGLEASVDGPVTRAVSYYFNFARSWAQEAGPVSGGLLGAVPTSYFYDDHDQTNTASFGLAYAERGEFATLDGEYGSGFPYGEIDSPTTGNPTALNYVRVPVHTTLNISLGTNLGHNQIAFTCSNLLNHGYLIKQASPLTDTQYAPGRSFGIKWTSNF